ncbi:MAG: TolC family protein [Proteobacteria bacterium]|nr:TolC family protein [Pseudomonadota bacterium]
MVRIKFIRFFIMIFLLIQVITTDISLAEEQGVLTVSGAVSQALNTNHRIHEQEAYEKDALEDYRMARADMMFKINTAYGYTDMEKQPIMKTGEGSSMPIAHQTFYSWHADIVQPLFTGLGLSANLKLKDLGRDIKRMEKEQTVLDVIRDVKKAYYQLLLYRKLLETAEESVVSLRAHADNAEKFHVQGLIPNNDLLKSQVGLANSLQNKVKTAGVVDISLSQLNLLLDQPMQKNIMIEDIECVPEFAATYEDLIEKALKERPVMRALNLGLKSIGLSARLARSSYFPKVVLVGRYEQSGEDALATENDFSHASNASLSVQAELTLFEWGKTQAQVAKVKHAYDAMASKIRFIENGVRLEVQNAFMELQVAKNNIETARKAQGQARENWRITELQYEQQVATSTDILDAQMFLTQANTNYFNAIYGYMIALAELERASGIKNLN